MAHIRAPDPEDHIGGNVRRVVGNPLKFRGAPEGEHRYPPALGEHNEEIYRGLLGLSERDIEELRGEGVI